MKIGKPHKWLSRGGDVYACKWCKRRLHVNTWMIRLPKGSVRHLPTAEICPVTRGR